MKTKVKKKPVRKTAPKRKATVKSDAAKPAAWTPRRRALMLRSCNGDMTAYGGFVWPTSGYVEATDWSKEAVCGKGLHGLLWGEGDTSLTAGDSPDAKWLVVEVDADDVVELGGKVKVPRGIVIFCGERNEAATLIAQDPGAAGKRCNYGTATAGDYGTATAGYRGTATAGDCGKATAGDCGTATAGDYGTATAGYRGTATAGDCGKATAGDCGTATAGDCGTATAGDYGTATAGYRGTATAGDCGKATAGYRGTATAGDCGTATAGDCGTATAGDYGTATAGYRGTATAGDYGTISILYHDAKRHRYRVAIAEVGENGIKPNTAYVIDVSSGEAKFVEKPQ